MTHSGIVLVCLAAGFLVCARADAVVADSAEETTETTEPTEPAEPAGTPYQAIVDRNVFGLKPMPPPPPPPEPKKEISKIILAGIATMGGNKKAMLKTQLPAKAGQPAQDQWYTLVEGQREGDIEVVEIDEKAGAVKVKQAGNVVTLDFETNGNKPPVAAVPVSAPGTPGMPGGIPAPAGGATMPGGLPAGLKPLPTRTLRAPGNPAGASTASPQGTTSTAVNASPSLSAQGGSVAANPTHGGAMQRSGSLKAWPPEVQLSPEEEAILIEAQRGQPGMPPLPPTALSGDLAPTAPAGQGTVQPVRTRPGLRAPSLPPIMPQ